MGVLTGKVVLVTGAGNGIGKECALLAAKEGAAVLVNDLGGGVAGGDTGSAAPAQLVADQIRAAGGVAIADDRSVTDYDAVVDMVDRAKGELGGLHAVISPAGILRDCMFHKMRAEDWRNVIDVHLHGAFNVCRASIEHFRDQGAGSYVLFTSTSGTVGNIGQANYAAAKMGVVGLSRVLAMESESRGVRCNAIAPFAWTRMLEGIPIRDDAARRRVERMRQTLRADQVAQLVVALCSDGARSINGQILAARGNEIFLFDQIRPIRAYARLEGWTPAAILEHAVPAMQSALTPVADSTRNLFNWEPI